MTKIKLNKRVFIYALEIDKWRMIWHIRNSSKSVSSIYKAWDSQAFLKLAMLVFWSVADKYRVIWLIEALFAYNEILLKFDYNKLEMVARVVYCELIPITKNRKIFVFVSILDKRCSLKWNSVRH